MPLSFSKTIGKLYTIEKRKLKSKFILATEYLSDIKKEFIINIETILHNSAAYW